MYGTALTLYNSIVDGNTSSSGSNDIYGAISGYSGYNIVFDVSDSGDLSAALANRVVDPSQLFLDPRSFAPFPGGGADPASPAYQAGGLFGFDHDVYGSVPTSTGEPLNIGAVQAAPDVIYAVNTLGDSATDPTTLSLREAILIVDGQLTPSPQQLAQTPLRTQQPRRLCHHNRPQHPPTPAQHQREDLP